MYFGTREEFEYFQCRACGCLQIDEIPVDLARHYPVNYYTNAMPHENRGSRLRRYLQARKCEVEFLDPAPHFLKRTATSLVSFPNQLWDAEVAHIPTILKRAKLRHLAAPILDVGCGSAARWLRQMRSLGFSQLVGVDPFLRDTVPPPGITLIKSDVSALKEADGRFSLITFHHSLEHIADQHAALRAARSLLADEGVCLVRIPITSASWTRYGVDWVELDAPRHLYLHSLTSIVLVAEVVGLHLHDVVFDTPDDGFEFYGSEQYRRDIPLHSPLSHAENPRVGLFSKEEMAAFRREAATANANGTAGRAGLYFRKSYGGIRRKESPSPASKP
jgi:2-polyprenyl-3-methyl-5-hydroxy-6-metoxy-1,4-benzoquinol methylase